MSVNKHYLKLWPTHFQATWVGDKPFEIRLNDRDYHERDEVCLQEWDPGDSEENQYSGREIDGVITYLTNYEQKANYVVFAVRVTGRTE